MSSEKAKPSAVLGMLIRPARMVALAPGGAGRGEGWCQGPPKRCGCAAVAALLSGSSCCMLQ